MRVLSCEDLCCEDLCCREDLSTLSRWFSSARPHTRPDPRCAISGCFPHLAACVSRWCLPPAPPGTRQESPVAQWPSGCVPAVRGQVEERRGYAHQTCTNPPQPPTCLAIGQHELQHPTTPSTSLYRTNRAHETTPVASRSAYATATFPRSQWTAPPFWLPGRK